MNALSASRVATALQSDLSAAGDAGRAWPLISLYSGVLGLERAFHWHGFVTVAACDSNPYCRHIIGQHLPGIPIYESDTDVTSDRLRTDGIDPGAVCAIVGGPPCQPSSLAGQRLGVADPRWRWPDALRIVGDIRPRWVVFEQPGLRGRPVVCLSQQASHCLGQAAWLSLRPLGVEGVKRHGVFSDTCSCTSGTAFFALRCVGGSHCCSITHSSTLSIAFYWWYNNTNNKLALGEGFVPRPRALEPRRCSFNGCTRLHEAHGLCKSHGDQLRRKGMLTPILSRVEANRLNARRSAEITRGSLVTLCCDYCRSDFTVRPSEVRHGRRFCSNECRYAGMRGPNGAGSLRYRTPISPPNKGTGNGSRDGYFSRTADGPIDRWRLTVYNRDNFTCQKCGDARGHNLRAHHIKPWAGYSALRFDVANGITLCDGCHKDEHRSTQRPCAACGATSSCKGLCARHYQQRWKANRQRPSRGSAALLAEADLEALGNSVVSLQVEPLAAAIAQIERARAARTVTASEWEASR